MCRRCRAQFDFHLGFQVVCNRDTGFEFISERALAKEEADRVRCFKIGDLQDSLIDREENDLAGAICLVRKAKRFSRLDRWRRLQIKGEAALLDVGGEMNDAVTERTN